MVLLEPNGIKEITYGSVLTQIRSLAFRLNREQIGPGDRIIILGENHPNWAIAYLAVLYCGAVAVPLDPSSSEDALSSYIKNSEAKLAFCSASSLDKLRSVCNSINRKFPIVILDSGQVPHGAPCIEEWTRTRATPDFDSATPATEPEHIALLIYTSGTTGVPKAVPLTHGNVDAESTGLQDVLHITDEEIILGLLPLFHVYSQMVNIWLAMIVGARVIYITELSGTEIQRALKEGGITALTGVPRLWYLFHKKIFDAVNSQRPIAQLLFRCLLVINGLLRDWFDINAGRFFFKRVHKEFGGKLQRAVSGGASFDAGVARDFHRMGFTILQGYGLTETSGAATVTRFEDNKIGSVGTPLNNVEVKIDMPNSEGIGEVLIRGPIVMPGYYRNAEANQDAFTIHGWFRSGDLGRFDNQGHLYIVGRKKDVIILPSGKNVYPEDVEAHYSRSQLVSEICVLGMCEGTDDFTNNERLCAVVVPNFEYLKANHITNVREAVLLELDNLGRELPEYQRARSYIVRAEPLPRTVTRKVRRPELLNQIGTLKTVSNRSRAQQKLSFTVADRLLMNSPNARVVVSIIRRYSLDIELIHPRMNIELDLGLDSLDRVEFITNIEQALGINFEPISIADAHTIGEVITLANKHKSGTASAAAAYQTAVSSETSEEPFSTHFNWGEILSGKLSDGLEVEPTLHRNPMVSFIAYLLLLPVYLAARLLLHMEVSGRDVVAHLDPPFMVCPNHQSYLDPFLVCSVYHHRILKRIFHIGASEYFNSPFASQLARLINIVPINPDVNLMRAMKLGAAGLRAGKILNIYPEGHRTFDGQLHEFKKGTAILAVEANVPIVPVALDGAYRVWPRKSWRINLAKVKIRFGEPIIPREIISMATEKEAAYEILTSLLKERIEGMLEEMRQAR